MSKRRALDQDFFKKWTPEMAYVLGYFAADGSMIKHANDGCFIEFTSTDRILLAHVQSAAASSHAVVARERGGNCRTTYRLQIGSIAWFRDLQGLGFTPSKSKNLQLPHIPAEVFGHFVRGYFDGDGCVYYNKLKYADRSRKRWVMQTLFTSGSKDFLLSLHAGLKTHGVAGGALCIKHNRRGFELKFSHRDSLALYKLMYHTGSVSNLFLPRKRDRFEQAVTVLGLDRNCGRSLAG